MKKTVMALSVIVLSVNGFGQNQEKAIDEVNLQGRFLSIPYNDVNENVTVITRQQIENSPATVLMNYCNSILDWISEDEVLMVFRAIFRFGEVLLSRF
jgi:outer membrane cobalamin receptor